MSTTDTSYTTRALKLRAQYLNQFHTTNPSAQLEGLRSGTASSTLTEMKLYQEIIATVSIVAAVLSYAAIEFTNGYDTGYYRGITSDGSGNLYFTVEETNAIYKVDSSGNITHFAGKEYDIDEYNLGRYLNHATNKFYAYFYNPVGITYNGGFLYVADTGNNAIRMINMGNGAVTTIAGPEPPSGGINIGEFSGDTDGTGAAASFNEPTAIVFYDGILYIADTDNNVIRRIVIETGVVTTLQHANESPLEFNQPQGITADGLGNLYISDTDNQLIRKIVINGSTYTLSTIAGVDYDGTGDSQDGIGEVARFFSPTGITYNNGYLYVVDYGNQAIRRIDLTTGIYNVDTIAGEGTPVDLALLLAFITTDVSGNLYVTVSKASEGAYSSKIFKITITS